jgi:hypothetical protein
MERPFPGHSAIESNHFHQVHSVELGPPNRSLDRLRVKWPAPELCGFTMPRIFIPKGGAECHFNSEWLGLFSLCC